MKSLFFLLIITFLLSFFSQRAVSMAIEMPDHTKRLEIGWQPFGSPYAGWRIVDEGNISKICAMLNKSTLGENQNKTTQSAFYIRPQEMDGCMKGSNIAVYNNHSIIISQYDSPEIEARSDDGMLYNYLLSLAKKYEPAMHAFFISKGDFYDKKSCEKTGGAWQPEDSFTKAICVFEYPDAGNWCSNNWQCSGKRCYKSVLFNSRKIFKLYEFLSIPAGKCVEKTTGKDFCFGQVVDNFPREINPRYSSNKLSSRSCED